MRILAFDLECTDLSANWGRILCASFGDITRPDAPVYTFRGDKRPHREKLRDGVKYFPGTETIDDSRLAVAIRDELEQADIIVSWNGILYDIPMLNARLQYHSDRPVTRGTWPHQSHVDAMYYCKGGSIKIGGYKLDTAAKFFGVEHQKTPLLGTTWQRAAVGERSAMNEVVEHCEADVEVLRDLFPILAVHVKKLNLPLNKWFKVAAGIQLP